MSEKMSFKKYMNINFLDFIYEAIEYSKENALTLEKSLTDLLREHIEKAIDNGDDFDFEDEQDVTAAQMLIDANMFTADEILKKKAINKEEKTLIKNVHAIIAKRIKENKGSYLFADKFP